MAATLEPLSVADIRPDQLYGIADFARLFPSRNGGRLSIDVARRWAALGKFGFFNMSDPTSKRKHWVTYGRSILGAIAAAEQTNPAAIAERLPTPAERLKFARQEMQAFADRTGRDVNSKEFGETFTPRKAASS